MKLTGSYKLSVKKEIVWQALNNPDILKQCIPGCESFVKESSTVFSVSATNQIGPMNATFSGKISLSNIKENESYTISGEGQSAVGFANGNADVKLTEKNGLTILSYKVDVNVGGKIAQVGSRLIDMTAKKMADIFFGKFSELLSSAEKKEDKKKDIKTVSEKSFDLKQINKKLLYATVVVVVLLAIYLLK